MKKARLVDAVRQEAGVSAAEAKKAVDVVFDAIAKSLKRGGELPAGFGILRVSKRAARAGRHPRTGEAIKIRASKSVRFKASATQAGTEASTVSQVVDLAERVFGNRETAWRWLGKRKDRFGGRTPLEMAETPSGAALVEEMLYQVDEGIAA